jgi:hypothetical protein
MNRQLDPHIKAAFDEIVAHTPEIGDTPTNDVVRLSPERSRKSRPWLAVAAATITVVGVAGLVAIRARPSFAPATQPPSVSNPAPTPVPNTIASPPEPTTPTPTTVTSAGTEIIRPGAVVCLDAGASQRAVASCADELGGDPIEAAALSADSFVMPVDPANPSHVTETARIGDVLNVPVRSLNTSLLPADTPRSGTAATTYLVLGASDIPYAP